MEDALNSPIHAPMRPSCRNHSLYKTILLRAITRVKQIDSKRVAPPMHESDPHVLEELFRFLR